MKSCRFVSPIDSCHMSTEVDVFSKQQVQVVKQRTTRHSASKPRAIAKVKIVGRASRSRSQFWPRQRFSPEHQRTSVNYLFTGICRAWTSNRECFFIFSRQKKCFREIFARKLQKREIAGKFQQTSFGEAACSSLIYHVRSILAFRIVK